MAARVTSTDTLTTHIMKRSLFLLLAFALGCTVTLKAQKLTKRFVGVWQKQELVHDQGDAPRLITLPVWKVFSSDGTFFTFLIVNDRAESIKMMEGTWSVKNDSVYEEHVADCITNPAFKGTTNRISYRLVSKDNMGITYQLDGAKHRAEETWIRVKLELPKSQREK